MLFACTKRRASCPMAETRSALRFSGVSPPKKLRRYSSCLTWSGARKRDRKNASELWLAGTITCGREFTQKHATGSYSMAALAMSSASSRARAATSISTGLRATSGYSQTGSWTNEKVGCTWTTCETLPSVRARNPGGLVLPCTKQSTSHLHAPASLTFWRMRASARSRGWRWWQGLGAHLNRFHRRRPRSCILESRKCGNNWKRRDYVKTGCPPII